MPVTRSFRITIMERTKGACHLFEGNSLILLEADFKSRGHPIYLVAAAPAN